MVVVEVVVVLVVEVDVEVELEVLVVVTDEELMAVLQPEIKKREMIIKLILFLNIVNQPAGFDNLLHKIRKRFCFISFIASLVFNCSSS